MFGFKKHKTYLTPDNGRNSVNDALQELLDAVVYFKNAIEEGDKFPFSQRVQLNSLYGKTIHMIFDLVGAFGDVDDSLADD